MAIVDTSRPPGLTRRTLSEQAARVESMRLGFGRHLPSKMARADPPPRVKVLGGKLTASMLRRQRENLDSDQSLPLTTAGRGASAMDLKVLAVQRRNVHPERCREFTTGQVPQAVVRRVANTSCAKAIF